MEKPKFRVVTNLVEEMGTGTLDLSQVVGVSGPQGVVLIVPDTELAVRASDFLNSMIEEK